MSRLKLTATSVFFFGYLFVQAAYPALSWFSPHQMWFAWDMFTGRNRPPAFAIVLEDGSRHDMKRPTSRSAPARLHSGSVNQRRYVPPFLCSRWPKVREVLILDRQTGDETVYPCRKTG